MDDIKKLHLKFKFELAKAKTIDDINKLHISYLGRNGYINKVLKKIKSVDKQKKKSFGKDINTLKNHISEQIKKNKHDFVQKTDIQEFVDVTLPGKTYPKGSLHPTTIAIEEITKIFENIGFKRVSYPEVEWEYFAFESLNMPKGHPARDEFETAFIDFPENIQYGKMLLTPHTSSGQNREMKRINKPPIRMINIAKTYRPNLDAIHTPMFHQFEGLVIDKDINITHLKGTIEYFAKEFFGENRKIRLRPFNFRFTEPSFEIDVSCGICNGKGIVNGKKCKVCKSGWLEIGGCGMVHPYVLKMGGIDPEKYSGWAFGFGPERCFMMKDEIKTTDLRMFYDSDIRFLEQF